MDNIKIDLINWVCMLFLTRMLQFELALDLVTLTYLLTYSMEQSPS